MIRLRNATKRSKRTPFQASRASALSAATSTMGGLYAWPGFVTLGVVGALGDVEGDRNVGFDLHRAGLDRCRREALGGDRAARDWPLGGLRHRAHAAERHMRSCSDHTG